MRDIVSDLLEKAFAERPDLFLIDLEVTPDLQIRVTIDGDQGVTVQDCIDVSRAVEHNLDRENDDFSLEVLSAGVSEPLSNQRQYKKNIGRTLKVSSSEGEFEGVLEKMTETEITLSFVVREKKPIGKGYVKVQKEATLLLDQITKAKVMIKF
ncbi:ribosome assembly cofactor RimP [Flavobacteriaceae bacterium]|nr:ribosome assembly cofactor RimP [Flavobacteriaceae bacterium]